MAKKIIHKHGRPKKESRVLSREIILEAGWHLALKKGRSSLTLKDLALALEVRPPSLYNHIQDITELLDEIAAKALQTLSQTLRMSLETSQSRCLNSQETFLNFCQAYREFANKYKEVYESILKSPSHHENHQKASEEILNVCQSALQLPQLNPEAVHKIRILRATLHGFVSLELNSGYGLKESVEVSFQSLVEMLFQFVASTNVR
jgi:AcrR family transcriptional regulator